LLISDDDMSLIGTMGCSSLQAGELSPLPPKHALPKEVPQRLAVASQQVQIMRSSLCTLQ